MFAYDFRPELFLRTPLWSYADYAPAKPEKALRDPLFRLALYLASPAFFGVLEAKQFDPGAFNAKELVSLRKYYNRLCFRPTPFGLFSAFTLAAWGNEGKLVVQGADTAKVHILPDQELAALIGKAAASDLFSGRYFLNPALYRLGSEFRFIRTGREGQGSKLTYALESLDRDPLFGALFNWLLKGEKTGENILAFVAKKTRCDREAALAYLAFLREAGLVFSSLDANIAGTDYAERLGDTPGLPRTPLAALLRRLRQLPAQALPGMEQELRAVLAGQGLPLPGKYFYVNTEKSRVSGAIPLLYQEKLIAALGALRRLSAPSPPALLDRFIRDFAQRFDRAKIPLLQALDPDAGVGYGDLAEQAGTSALLKEIHFPSKAEEARQVTWSPAHRLLLDQWQQTQDGTIRLKAADIAQLPEPAGVQPPPSLAVLFRITGQGLLIESAGGVTANALAGRFTTLSGGVAQLGREIAAQEQENNPGVVFAEIGQLSDHYTDNVNRRQHLYRYEIPVNAVSLLPQDQQVALRDLLVSVDGGEVILESVRLQKRIVPRLSSAYNFRHNNLAVFRFLCELQYQSLQADLSFDPAQFFPGMAHYPRVEYEGVILSPAKWRVSGDLAALSGAELRTRLNLPGWIALTRFDQQLVFHLEDPEQLRFFEDCTRGMNDYELREFFLPPPQAGPVHGPDGRPLVNQLIAFLVSRDTVYRPLPVPGRVPGKVQRDFIPGSSWLYLKIYCNPHAANDLLVRRVLPVIRELARTKGTSWFFVRYADPGPHIRLRLRIPEAQTGPVLQRFKDRFAGLVSGQLVREYQADTYRRELERYGSDLIETAEDFFRASSDLVMGFLKNQQKTGAETDRLAISSFGLLLDHLLPDLAAQTAFLGRMSAAFYAEFNGDKAFRLALDQLYRGSGREFAARLQDRALYRELQLQNRRKKFVSAIQLLEQKMQGFEQPRREALLADCIHMHLNRLYSDRQRQQEFVLYYCFHKHKQSRLAIERRASPGVPLVME